LLLFLFTPVLCWLLHLCTKEERLLFLLFLKFGYHISVVSINPCASVCRYNYPLSTANHQNIRWSFHPLMHSSVEGCYPLKLSSVDALIRWRMLSVDDFIRWSFRDIRWSLASHPLKVFKSSVDTTSLIQNYKAWSIYNWPSYLHII